MSKATMSASALNILISEQGKLLRSMEVSGRLELGRQKNNAEELFNPTWVDASQPSEQGRWRAAIAQLDEMNISRSHLLLEPRGTDRVVLKNVSSLQSVGLSDGCYLEPQASREIALPALITLGKKSIRVQQVTDEQAHLQSLAETSLAPGAVVDLSVRYDSLAKFGIGDMEVESLMRWLQAALGVLQSAASSLDFFARATRAVVDLVGLDSAQVLLFQDGDWQVQATHPADAAEKPSRRILQRIREEKRTFWQTSSVEIFESLHGVNALVAAPILDQHGAVIGALYGSRREETAGGGSRPITKLEAMLVDLLAGGVAAGLARVEQEKDALRARVQFEQFFTPELARHLAAQPDLLKGRDMEVTLLFCDMRGFSRISDRLGPVITLEWINDVMNTLSRCVLAHQGVLVDYIGDELIAMWGAPQEQPDHATRACRTALAMLEKLPALNERWQVRLQEPIDFGIGINTGGARVGNTGSDLKFKYGPLGTTVNVASRVQGATKYLQTKLLITDATRAKLEAGFETRRLCQVRVVNIPQPVTLYELATPGQPDWAELKAEYESALDELERKSFRKAAGILGNLLPRFPEDGPSLVLLSRALNPLIEKATSFDPVWELPGK